VLRVLGSSVRAPVAALVLMFLDGTIFHQFVPHMFKGIALQSSFTAANKQIFVVLGQPDIAFLHLAQFFSQFAYLPRPSPKFPVGFHIFLSLISPCPP
jgi:hypothetical protein